MSIIQSVRLSVSDAFGEALDSTRRRDGSRQYWLKDQKKFTSWINEAYHEVEFFDQITRAHIRQYMASELASRSDNGIRLALQPIVQTAGYMAREYGIPNVTVRLGLVQSLIRPTPMVAMTDVIDFINWLAERCPRIAAGAALQGLAGLQLQEALRLTWDRVDLERGLIEITGEVKNDYRERVIPVCSFVAAALLNVWASQGGPGQGVVIRTSTGLGYTRKDGWRQYSHELRNWMREWNNDLSWAPKDLRNCLPTFATMAGIKNDLWEQYIGHAPASITAKHYVPKLTSASIGEREALLSAMDTLRKIVTAEIELEIERIKANNAQSN
jgi:integrase